MTTGVELRFDAIPVGYEPPSSEDVYLGGGPAANPPAGTIGPWAIRPPRVGHLVATRQILSDPQLIVDLDFATVSGNYTPDKSASVVLDFSKKNGKPEESRSVYPWGWQAGELGAQVIWNFTTSVTAVGVDALSVGTPSATNWLTYAKPGGIGAPAVGSHSIILKDRPLSVAGFDALAGGTPSIVNRNRYVTAGGITPPSLSRSNSVWLYTRYLLPGGASASRFGAQAVTHGKRYVDVGGIAAPSIPRPWASRSPRSIEPEGMWLDAVGRPVIVTPRTITARGWDCAAFGTRIIPEDQDLYPMGFRAEQWGGTVAWNWKSVAAPPGFALSPQESDRFGFARVWNLRQIIRQNFDGADGLNPPGFGIWTAIENRNRVIVPTGIGPGRFGYSQIDNKASPVRPPGVEPPAVMGGAVTHKNRPVEAGGMVSPPISIWHVVHNAARVVSATGADMALVGVASLENNRRVFRGIGGIEALSVGVPFIAFRIRGIEFDPRYTIAPPEFPLPEAKLFTRYITPPGFDAQRFGSPSLSIHWNIIAPKWAHRDFIGEPLVQNGTPEFPVFGHDSAEFGQAEVKLFSRFIVPAGSVTQEFGRPGIADSRRTVLPGGVNMLRVSDKLTVVRTGAPPYSTQNIIIESGNGIDASAVFGTPSMNERSIRVAGIEPIKIPSPIVYYIGINVAAGPKTDAMGKPAVQLKRRFVNVGEFKSDQVFEPSAAAVSPHTIYAVMEAPAQALANHPPRHLHFVGGYDNKGVWVAGERFGLASVSRPTGAYGVSAWDVSRYGDARVDLRRRYVAPRGIQAYRFGWHKASNGVDTLQVFGSPDTVEFGSAAVSRGRNFGPQTVRPSGLAPPVFTATHWASLRHREVRAQGAESLLMGFSRGGTEYMPQSLRVGPRKPTIPAGFDVSATGTPWVSLRIRELRASGFDAFVSEYEPQFFSQRMRVTRIGGGVQKPAARAVGPAGFDAQCIGTPDVRNLVHYIRPDGNSDQFRKGAF